MRKFLGILLAVFGIGALFFAFLGLGTDNLVLMAAEVLTGAVMLWSAVVMFRSQPVDEVNVDVYRDDTYPTARG